MNCMICGQESMPGAKLCADCRSARKRAFAATVTQPLLEAAGTRRARASGRLLKPSQSMAATTRRAARRLKAEKASPLVDTPSPRRGLIPIILIAVVVVLAAGAYGAHRMKGFDTTEEKLDAHAAPVAPAQAATAPVAPGSLAPGAVTPAAVTPNGAVPTGAAATSAAGPVNETPLPVPQERVSQSPSTPSAKRQPARSRAAAAPAVITLPPSDGAPAIVLPTPMPPPPPAPKPVVREDPWQQFNEGLAGCAREDLATRLRCEQRIRVRYCDGQWGVAPQCPIGPNTDHGQ
jgi:hypothetical protein